MSTATTTPQRNDDFVTVRLTADGVAQAGYASPADLPPGQVPTPPTVRVMGGPSIDGFTFTPGQTVRVTRAYDWERVLRPVMTLKGTPMFEVVDDGGKVTATGYDVFSATGPLTGVRADYDDAPSGESAVPSSASDASGAPAPAPGQ